MSFAAIASNLRQFADSTLAPLLPSWTISNPNTINGTLAANTKKARLEIHFESALHAGFGAGLMIERTGSLDIVFAVPSQSGDGEIFERAAAVANATADLTNGDVRFTRAGMKRAAPEEGAFVQAITIPWRWRGTSPIATDYTTTVHGDFAAGGSQLRQQIQAQIAAIVPITVVFGNAPDLTFSTSQPIAFVDVLYGTQSARNLGNDADAQLIGIVNANIYTLAGSGDGQALEIADAFNAALMAREFGPVEVGIPNIESQRLDGPWWVTNLVAAFSVSHQPT